MIVDLVTHDPMGRDTQKRCKLLKTSHWIDAHVTSDKQIEGCHVVRIDFFPMCGNGDNLFQFTKADALPHILDVEIVRMFFMGCFV